VRDFVETFDPAAEAPAAPRLLRQRTLKSPVGCSGIGLHSGQTVSMTIRPAADGTGILFRRTDLPRGAQDVAAHWRNVVDTRLATTIGNDAGARIGTIEHLMSAFAGCGVDNAIVELDAAEVPVMDGSAAPFVFLIECAGIAEQRTARRAIEVTRPVVVHDGEKSIAVYPASGFSVSFEIDFASGAIARQSLGLRFMNGSFKTDIARARTFGFEHEVSALREAGLARGGSLDNAVVIRGDTVLNVGGLRYDDEFVRHKILDCIGDLYLAGGPIVGRVEGARSGHALNHKLVVALMTDESAWTYTDRAEEGLPPMGSDHVAEPLASLRA
jgi:UDP-3-O-[3-hydroxymyristoyl] N-acetylglucosamine deacetylase